MPDHHDYWKEDDAFPRFLTVEEAARMLGVLPACVSQWIGELKLPVAARSEYAGFLLRTYTVETVGRKLAEAARHRRAVAKVSTKNLPPGSDKEAA